MENINFCFGPEIPVINIEKKDDIIKKADSLLEQARQMVEEVEKIKEDREIIDCECGGSYTRRSKGGHYRSNVHRNHFSK
jgi:hypothetical protein